MSGDNERTELWTYGGLRVGRGGKRYHAWRPPERTPENLGLFATLRGSYVVGSVYEARVEREDDGITVIGQPQWQQQSENPELRAELEVAHRAARTTLDRRALESRAKRNSALDEAIAPLVELARKRPSNQRDAFATYVLRKLHRVW